MEMPVAGDTEQVNQNFGDQQVNQNTPAAIQRLVRANHWTPEAVARVLAYAAYKDDVELVLWVLEESQLTKLDMVTLGFHPLFVAAANDRLHAFDALVKYFNVLSPGDCDLRANLLATALQCGAVVILAHIRDTVGLLTWVPDATHPAITDGIHAALTEAVSAKFKDVLEYVLNDMPGLTLEHLQVAGILGRLVDQGQWYLLRAALRLPDK